MKQPFFFSYLILGIFLSLGWNLRAQEKAKSGYTLDELNQSVSWPQPQAVSVTARDARMVTAKGNKNETSLRNTLPQLIYLSEKASLDLRPYFAVKLANVYADLDEDPAAYQRIDQFLDKKGNQPYQGGIDGFPQTYDGLRRYAHLLQARILARNGLNDACTQVLANCQTRTGYEELLYTEICALLGDKNSVKTHLIQALNKPDGHPESNWSQTYISLRGISIASSMGLDSLVTVWGTPLVQKGQEAERRPHWRSSWAIMNKILGFSRDGAKIDWHHLKDGTFTGICRGFEGDLQVSLTVADGRIKDVKIVSEAESRPYSALTVIPQRILKHQNLTVDAVTGATVTSCAIITAAEDALINASR